MSFSAGRPLRVRGSGLELAALEWGDHSPGPPVLLLHGITGRARDWRQVAAQLPDRRLIAIEARGHGESDWDPAEDYSVDAHFSDVASALDDLGIERCLLVGFSMGGGTAITTAACLPERVAGLVVVDAYPYPQQSHGSARIARWVAGQTQGAGFDPAIARRFGELLDAGVTTRADLTSLWQAVQCPTVVVRGAASPVLPESVAATMTRDLPHAQLVTIEGVAHGVPFARPSELASVIEALALAGGAASPAPSA